MIQGSGNISEIKGDLFTSDDNLAHCVSADFKMSAGIAKTFKAKFGQKEALLATGVGVGKCAVLRISSKEDNVSVPKIRYIFYLVTKEKYWQKPTYETLRDSLRSMYEYCKKHDITSISMPRIGCGLDGLEWSKVRKIVLSELKNILITVFSI